MSSNPVQELIEKTSKFLGINHDPELATIPLAVKGENLLLNPRWNKGTAFTEEERKIFGLRGRLPYAVNSLEQQLERAYKQLQEHESPIRKNSFLQSLKAQNWVLYFALLERHLKELMPIVYTPTEAEAISNYSSLFRRSEGLYLSYPHSDTMEEEFLDAIEGREIDLVVVSDAEAILGIGDQGVGGIGISTAKATIYSLIGGIDPARALAVTLDVGTNNKDLLKDHLYVGWSHKRKRGDDYDEFVDKFVQLIRKHLPHSLLHFEDFGVTNAQRLLDKYRDQHTVFNDDVQGTGAVTLATVMSAVGIINSKLSEQNIIVYGAGSAGLGIARQIRDAMVTLDGLDKTAATRKFWLVDRDGLVTNSLAKNSGHVGWQEFSQADISNNHLLEVIKEVKPSILIGTSTHGGAFNEEVVKEMAKHVDRPIILPLSNPSKLVEVDPKDAMKWTEGKALLATGSPFPEVDLGNGKKAIIAECNNALIYPGLGLGAIISKARKLSDGMLIAGTRKLASLSPAYKSTQGDTGKKGVPEDRKGNVPPLLPDFEDSPGVNLEVAIAVAEQAIEEGIAGVDWGKEKVREEVEKRRWRPVYAKYVYNPQGLE